MKITSHTVPVRRFTDVQFSMRCWRHFCSHYLLSIFYSIIHPRCFLRGWNLVSLIEGGT